MTDMLREIKAAEIGRFHVLPDGQGTDLPDYGVLDGNNKVPRGRCLGPIKPDGSPGFGAELMRQIKARIDAYGIPCSPATRLSAWLPTGMARCSASRR
ncbi:hypothetical protein ACFSTI_34740 [Rhizorhabdus histidinilytica]